MTKTADKEEAELEEWRRIELEGCTLLLDESQYRFVERYARLWHRGDLRAAVVELAKKPEGA